MAEAENVNYDCLNFFKLLFVHFITTNTKYTDASIVVVAELIAVVEAAAAKADICLFSPFFE